MRDDADLDGLATLIMTHAFGRTPLPPEVAGVLAISHLLATAKPEDRQGIRQLATAWFTDQPSTVTDPARWSVRSAARLPAAPSIPLAGHSSNVSGITAFTTRDGHQRLASAGFDGTIRVWDPFTARQVGDPLIGHGGKVIRLISMALDDAVLLVSAHQDGLVRFWDAEIQLLIGEPLAAHRDFTYALDTCVIDGCDLLTTGVPMALCAFGTPLLASRSESCSADTRQASPTSPPSPHATISHELLASALMVPPRFRTPFRYGIPSRVNN